MDEQIKNLNQLLLAAMDAYARQTCFRIKRGRYYQSISYRRFQTLVFRLTAFFLGQGVVRIAIAVDNCLEWMTAYVACLLSGGSVVPLRPSLAPDMLLTILFHRRFDGLLSCLGGFECGFAFMNGLFLDHRVLIQITQAQCQ